MSENAVYFAQKLISNSSLSGVRVMIVFWLARANWLIIFLLGNIIS
ncbi:MAG: hypothetical protein SFU27_10150 [Thermonemataceae bacterium]|nr:hypothetical protein [Thermonemataceae bacterium]